MPNHITITGTKWVVFNPTAEDFENSNETSTDADKDLLGIRFWLTKKEGSEAYNYAGVGDYSGPITDIAAIKMSPGELTILADSPKWETSTFLQIEELNNNWIESESNFKKTTLAILDFLLIQEDSTPANVASAYTALQGVTDSLSVLNFDAAYTAANDSAPTGSYTTAIKTDLISLISTYIEKYPR